MNTYASMHDGSYSGIVRIFVGLSCELYCQQQLLEASNGNPQEEMERKPHPKMSLSQCMIVITTVFLEPRDIIPFVFSPIGSETWLHARTLSYWNNYREFC